MYPCDTNPNYGIFVKEQIDAIERIQFIEKRIYVVSGQKGFFQYVRSIFEVRRIIKKGHFDLIHIHYGLSGLFLLFGRMKVPVLLTLHGGDILSEQGKIVQVALTKRILRKCDYAITLNERMDKVAKNYILNTTIIPCSVNIQLFQRKKEKQIDSNEIKILFPSSRTRVVKDYPLFSRVCEVLREKYEFNIKEYVIENLSRQEVANLYNNVDILLMTSISEGSPQVVKEAMACDLPVVSTDVGDVRELLRGVRKSYVADSRDENILASLVCRSLKENEEGISPREQILKLKLDDDSIALKIVTLYKDIVMTEGRKNINRESYYL